MRHKKTLYEDKTLRAQDVRALINKQTINKRVIDTVVTSVRGQGDAAETGRATSRPVSHYRVFTVRFLPDGNLMKSCHRFFPVLPHFSAFFCSVL